MTRKEFEKQRASIEEQSFIGDFVNPIEYGIQRAGFEKRKFQKLITAARKVDSKTARAKSQQWQRQLVRAESSCERFKQLRKEIEAAKIRIQPLSTPINEKIRIRLRPH